MFIRAAQPHNTAKRDFLREVETRIQAKWEAEKIFEANAPAEGAIPTLGREAFPNLAAAV